MAGRCCARDGGGVRAKSVTIDVRVPDCAVDGSNFINLSVTVVVRAITRLLRARVGGGIRVIAVAVGGNRSGRGRTRLNCAGRHPYAISVRIDVPHAHVTLPRVTRAGVLLTAAGARRRRGGKVASHKKEEHFRR